jgi:hypothetical protein
MAVLLTSPLYSALKNGETSEMKLLQLSDLGPLATLTLGMLGLGGLHVAERVKEAA